MSNLSFLILKVNQIDVQHLGQDEILKLLIATKDPIQVELKRRVVSESSSDTTDNEKQQLIKTTTSIGIQTDEDSPESDQIDLDGPEMDIEEIVLQKSSGDENLGIIVSYSSDDTDSFTEVYVSEIAVDSIADRDGRLRSGDQILQINGTDVMNKEETELLLGSNHNELKLLVSRCCYSEDETGNNISSSSSSSTSTFLLQEKPTTFEHLTNSNDPLDHRRIKAHLESVNQEISILESRMENVLTIRDIGSYRKPYNRAKSDEFEPEHIYETIPEEPIYCSPYESKPNTKNLVKQWIKLNQIENTVNETQQSQMFLELNTDTNSSYLLCKMKNCRKCNHTTKSNDTERTIKTSVSAPKLPGDTMYTNMENLQQTMLLQQHLFRQALKSSTPNKHFTAPNLSQYKFVSSRQEETEILPAEPSLSKNNLTSNDETIENKVEWKLKRRKDGTRYIVKRPVRNQILKNRAPPRIAEDRCELTTEEDTISESKIGRYWNRNERKKHIKKARERRQRQESLIQIKNNQFRQVNETINQPTGIGVQQNNILPSPSSVVASVTLSSPNSQQNQQAKMVGLLSVTTV